MKKLSIALLSTVISTMAFAENVIVTETSTWKSVPITVDAEKKTYKYEGTLPTENYYFSYSGYRCFTEKRTVVGVDGIVYKSSSGGSDIYCYAE